jgi:hypothetical protein
MHRPRLLTLVTSWLEAGQTTPFDAATPLVGRGLADVAGRAYVATESGSGPVEYLTAFVRAYETDMAAASATRALLADAGDVRDLGGIAVVNRRERPLPDSRGGVVTWGTVRGFDAERATWATAVVRHGHLVWDITVTGVGRSHLERAAIDIAGTISRREPDGWGLWDLLPAAGELPGSMRVDAVFTSPALATVAA